MSKSKGRKGSKTSADPMDGLPSKPRVCALDKGSGGYGFNLHGEKGKHGQFIRAVDPGLYYIFQDALLCLQIV